MSHARSLPSFYVPNPLSLRGGDYKSFGLLLRSQRATAPPLTFRISSAVKSFTVSFFSFNLPTLTRPFFASVLFVLDLAIIEVFLSHGLCILTCSQSQSDINFSDCHHRLRSLSGLNNSCPA